MCAHTCTDNIDDVRPMLFSSKKLHQRSAESITIVTNRGPARARVHGINALL